VWTSDRGQKIGVRGRRGLSFGERQFIYSIPSIDKLTFARICNKILRAHAIAPAIGHSFLISSQFARSYYNLQEPTPMDLVNDAPPPEP
jgi:hypothetical protein